MFYSHENVQSLEEMSLRGFQFNPNQPSFTTFASLKTLCFYDCVIDGATLKELVSNCPVLECLAIDSCFMLLNFKTSWCRSRRLKRLLFSPKYMDKILNLQVDEMPSLSSLQFFGDLNKISLSSLPSLVEASLFQREYYRQDKKLDQFDEYIRILVGNISYVKQLGVDSWFPKVYIDILFIFSQSHHCFQ